ncbi:hypothetical protein [Anoxynatronum sibiricum]|uniref:Uncharacterized protein n=1 Tax=Anoxynatronum sibiricum TaxID=210623 RepID=A0ABU9VYC8_9CLOT
MKGQFSVARQPFQPITHIALTRQAIVETSLQRFDDEDPCIIHETHCRHWLALALMEQLQCHHGEQLGRPMAIGQAGGGFCDGTAGGRLPLYLHSDGNHCLVFVDNIL